MATIAIKGLVDAERAVGLDVPAVVDPVMEISIRRMQARLMTYPAPPPSSTYRRTGTLGRRWQVEGGNMRWVLGNNTVYGPEVEGEQQTAVHKRTGWPTTELVAADEEAGLVSDTEAALKQATGGQ